MKLPLKYILKAIAPTFALKGYRAFKKQFFAKYVYRNTSYSQNGEDRVLWRYFERQRNGFYVDIGAHHPFRFSNTALFYEANWRGINVDAMPNSMKAFNKYRKRDVNLESAVGIDSTGGG